MPRVRSALLAALITLLGLAAPASAQTILSGSDGVGGYVMIAVPTNWNGDLAIWNHDYDFEPVDPLTPSDLGPFAPLQLSQGYAVAASSYSQTGWAAFTTNRSLETLYQIFEAFFGTPGQVYLVGASLGGIVTMRALEKAQIGNVVGALIGCGAVAGSRDWDGALDLRLIYDAVCKDVPGAAIPGGAKGLPKNSTITPAEVALRVNACTGVDLPYGARTPDQQQRLDKILYVAQIPENFLQTDMFYATTGLADLVHDPTKLDGKIGAGNELVDYGDADINESIARVNPRDRVESRLRRNYTPTGDVGNAKIISLHTDKDGLVVVENERHLLDVVDPANLSVAIVVESVPSHCGFSDAEVVAGWESLRLWVAGAPKPTAAQIKAVCLQLAPIFGGDCRIDPSYVVQPLDNRIRPRIQ